MLCGLSIKAGHVGFRIDAAVNKDSREESREELAMGLVRNEHGQWHVEDVGEIRRIHNVEVRRAVVIGDGDEE